MNDTQINHLIAARNSITDRTEDYTNNAAVWHIDTVLRDVPQGQRPDVDKLLGRYADIVATLERHSATPPGWFVNPAVTLELDAESAALLAQHNAEVDRRKANGDKRHGGMTYTILLEQAQREGKV